MITMGGWEVETLADQWTIVTRDRSMAAHFEHTVVLTENGPEVLSVTNGKGTLGARATGTTPGRTER
jgi:methionyl aminopeptidase